MALSRERHFVNYTSVNSWNQIFQSQLSDFFQLIFINKRPLVFFMLATVVYGRAVLKWISNDWVFLYTRGFSHHLNIIWIFPSPLCLCIHNFFLWRISLRFTGLLLKRIFIWSEFSCWKFRSERRRKSVIKV